MPLRVFREQAPGNVERDFVPDACEDIEDFPLCRRGLADAVGCQKPDAQPLRDCCDGLVPGF